MAWTARYNPANVSWPVEIRDDATDYMVDAFTPEAALALSAALAQAAADARRRPSAADVKPPRERSCFTCRWVEGRSCVHPVCTLHDLNEEQEQLYVKIGDYCDQSGASLAKNAMPTDRTLACPGHEDKP